MGRKKYNDYEYWRARIFALQPGERLCIDFQEGWRLQTLQKYACEAGKAHGRRLKTRFERFAGKFYVECQKHETFSE